MLTQITIQNLRIIEHAQLFFKPGINLIIGNNGAGKTTLLEAVYLLSRGRSFRHRESGPLIKEGEEHFLIVSHFLESDQNKHVLGMQRSRSELLVKFDGKPSVKRSDILINFPIVLIGAEPQQLLSAGPDIRRSFIDYGMFHVEHQYLSVIQQYNRALDQRNASLRKGIGDLSIWDKTLDVAAQKIDYWRSLYCKALITLIQGYLDQWQLNLTLDIRYQRGWSHKKSFIESLTDALLTDRKQKFTSVGIQRADLVIKSVKTKSGKRLSRGQLKMLAAAFHFAQTDLSIKHGAIPPILLFDDLPAELDEGNRLKLLKSIDAIYPQSLLTVLSENDVPLSDTLSTVFHVEHGDFTLAE